MDSSLARVRRTEYNPRKRNGRVDPAAMLHRAEFTVYRGIFASPKHSVTDITSLRDADCLGVLFLPTLGPYGTRFFWCLFLSHITLLRPFSARIGCNKRRVPVSVANRIDRRAANTDAAAPPVHTRSMRLVPHRYLRGLFAGVNAIRTA